MASVRHSSSLQKIGPFRESNPGPPAPKAGIMPLDQTDLSHYTTRKNSYIQFIDWFVNRSLERVA
jgi:hypothetical protein